MLLMLAHQMVGIREYVNQEMLQIRVALLFQVDLLYLLSLLYRDGVRLRVAGDWLPRLFRTRVGDRGLLLLRRQRLLDAPGDGLCLRATRSALFRVTYGWMPMTRGRGMSTGQGCGKLCCMSRARTMWTPRTSTTLKELSEEIGRVM